MQAIIMQFTIISLKIKIVNSFLKKILKNLKYFVFYENIASFIVYRNKLHYFDDSTYIL